MLAELRAAPATAHVAVIVVSVQPQVLQMLIRADAMIAKPFALDTLLAEVSRSRQRAVNALPIAVHDVTHP